ncbi:hypothetical protein [Deinococcus aluminii]|uniref:Uncharacterized protein n=1 Tax=Deinococcus aluminii TaxID=1656885 RepID=A0ABP9XH74_9DEIO
MTQRQGHTALPDLPPRPQAVFRLPHGSIVTYVLPTSAWSPVRDVPHEQDLLPYWELKETVARLPAPPTRRALEAAAREVKGTLKRWISVPRPTALPAPLPRPRHPEYSSLTGYLRHTPEARQAIRTALTQPLPRPPETPLRCVPLGANPGLVGTAFDYALRFLVQGRNPHLLPVRGMLAARLAVFGMNREQVLNDVNSAEATLQEVADGLSFEERHARSAVVLASYEVVARTGLFQDLAGVVPPAASRDVLALAQNVPQEAFRAGEQLILNPRFPAAGRFGGADADLLIDDLLIEVKATKHLHLEGSYLQQLTGYLVLDRLAGTQGSTLPIRRLGVYYARHGVLQVMPVRDLFRPGLLPQLVSWFDDSLPRA